MPFVATQCTVPRAALQSASLAFINADGAGLEEPVGSQVVDMASQIDALLVSDPGEPVCIWTTLLWSVGNMLGDLAGVFSPDDMPVSAECAAASLDIMTAAADNLPCP